MKCENCSLEFEQTAGERALRTKLSPLIGEKKFELPEPTCCPDCRNQKRAAFRNERKLYKRKCENCNKEIISVYSPDKNLNALCRECFWSDKIDNNKYAKNYDANVPFFKQFEELIQVSKLLGLFAQNNENSEYVNQEMDVKNCYMCVGGHWNTDCLHCTFSIKGDNNCDCFFVWESNNLYECISCQKCSNSKYLNRCHNCSNCYLSEDLIGCNDCFGCCNLRRKQYCFFNEQLEKAEYEQRVKEALTDKKSKESVAKKFEEHRLKFAKKFAMNLSCEDCFGDNLANCKKLGNCFWSDKWDPRSYGQDFDSSKPFFEQFKELQAKTPRIALLNSRSENSEYANHATRSKDCYLVFASFDNENVMFSWRTRESREVLEAYACSKNCELCYEGYRLENCYKTNYSANCQNCRDSNFLSDCTSCKDCYMCVSLNNKQFCYLNEQLTKEEYDSKVPNLRSRKIVDEEKAKFSEFLKNQPRPFAHIVNSENCLGDDLIHCANCDFCFDIESAEDCKNFDNGENLNNCQDVYGGGYPAEWMYEVHGVLDGHYVAFSHASYYSTRVYYADKCYNCQDIFGSVSLKKNQYCILNKQYTKEEYEKKVAEIIAKMTETGEWGEFFPTSLSPFGYNETMALERFPMSKEEATAIGAKWLDGDYTPKYDGESYEPKDNIKDYTSEEERAKLLSGIIKCGVSGMPYKITPQELAFYLKNNIPIPTKHYSISYKERMEEYSPKRKLYHRSCMNEGCSNEFETTYAPDRTEKVYCEKCYQNIVK